MGGRRTINLAGRRFGRLVVICRSTITKDRNAWWNCKCDCGQTIDTRSNSLRRGDTKSCGCLHRETGTDNLKVANAANTKHGHALENGHSRTYDIWQSAKQRCTNSNSHNWKNYGGRGIRMCARWLNSFENFLADMGEKPEGLSIDRKDNDGNYEPGNCRWATRKQQRANQRARVA